MALFYSHTAVIFCKDEYFCRCTQECRKIDKIVGHNCVNLAFAYIGEIPNLINVLLSHKYTIASLFTAFTKVIFSLI